MAIAARAYSCGPWFISLHLHALPGYVYLVNIAHCPKYFDYCYPWYIPELDVELAFLGKVRERDATTPVSSELQRVMIFTVLQLTRRCCHGRITETRL
jgi:hypothetical protein